VKMMHVTFAEAVSPYGVGDKRLVPADVAAQLEREGKLSACDPFPPEGKRRQKAHHRPAPGPATCTPTWQPGPAQHALSPSARISHV
jgi:hypothetical protein